MATPADQRLLELCDKWLKSLELHIRYSSLDSDSYWKVQPWPEHQRPSRWIIDVAVQKAVALRAQVQERIKQGDSKFSEALELMTFLANLIGSEHIERFIPLADPETEQDLKAPPDAAPVPAPAAPAPAPARSVPPPAASTPQPAAASKAAPTQSAPAPRPRPAESPAAAAPPTPPAPPARASDSTGATATREMPRPPLKQRSSSDVTGTREMPEFVPPKRRAAPVGTQQVARTERRSAQSKPAPRPSARQPAKLPPSEDAAREQVIADAARLVQWGRKWYELAELIARMADRPPLSEVRKILKDHKTAIEKKAGGR
jgi:hypothetical protein